MSNAVAAIAAAHHVGVSIEYAAESLQDFTGIKRRMEMSNEWYRRMAMKDIIQGGGRIVRSAEDEGTVYILDGSFGYLYSNSVGMVPKWWKDSFKTL